MQVVILAAGFGTRLQNVLNGKPKSLAPIGGTPLIEHQLKLLASQGLLDIIICTGYQGNQIQQYCDAGRKWNMNITYSHEDRPHGTATTLNYIKPLIKDDFLMFYGDLALNMNFHAMIDEHQKYQPLITLAVQASNHPYDCDLVEESDGYAVKLIPKNRPPGFYPNLINGAVQVCTRKIFDYISDQTPDFDKDVLPLALANGEKVLAYRTVEYIQDIGTKERYQKVSQDFDRGYLNRENLKKPKKAIFLDRDGTINQYIDQQYISHPDGMKLLPGVAPAIKRINDSDYLAICLTNQGGIAKKQFDQATMQQIHNKMETLLVREMAYLDRIYLCPHHHEISPCECRKPKVGMALQAKNDYNIDLSNSFMIGDTSRDIEMGQAVGMTTVLLKSGASIDPKSFTEQPDLIFDTLELAINHILRTQ